MIAEELSELQDAKPFRPFEVHLADGPSFVITHPKWMMISPSARVLHFIGEDRRSHKVAIPLITRITEQQAEAEAEAPICAAPSRQPHE